MLFAKKTGTTHRLPAPPPLHPQPRSGLILGACAPHVPDGTTVPPALPFQAVVFLPERREGQRQAGSEGRLPEALPADGLAVRVPDEENWNVSAGTASMETQPAREPCGSQASSFPARELPAPLPATSGPRSNETRAPGVRPRRLASGSGCTQAGGLQPTFPTNTSIPGTSGHTAMEKLSGEQERMRRRRVWIPGLRPFGEWPALPEGSNQNEEVSIVTTLQLIRGRRLTVPLF
ncbi:uncharacterized protein [Manis javanica]|uniref:uncharacterized protein isoform X2 n=1 Tax=Manis javanica TaxID=9974 RepID=UPI003C6CFC7A